MNFPTAAKTEDLAQIARATFDAAQRAVDARQAVQKAVRVAGERLFIDDSEFDWREIPGIYAIALGKAAAEMASALSNVVGDKLRGGVISCPKNAGTFSDSDFPRVWKIFHGGHPLPNQESLAAARAAFALLERANNKNSLVIILVSGGGSAMMELPCNEEISLANLQTTNQVLVNCGAKIGEINALRRRISRVKGGGLRRAAENAKQVTLIISDTNDGEAYNVASGPTMEPENDLSEAEIAEIMRRYELTKALPRTVVDCLEKPFPKIRNPILKTQHWQVLSSNSSATTAAANQLREFNFAVEMADDLIETQIDEGCAELVKRLGDLRTQTSPEQSVAIVSGGEFACPVRGSGTGGRNLESALRTAILFNELKKEAKWQNANFVALYAGTDGIDGNSPATGAVCTETTIERAKTKNLDADKFLETSDSYNFFAALDDQIEIGATGTNVRDIRILLAY